MGFRPWLGHNILSGSLMPDYCPVDTRVFFLSFFPSRIANRRVVRRAYL